jgi:hypothetical protein
MTKITVYKDSSEKFLRKNKLLRLPIDSCLIAKTAGFSVKQYDALEFNKFLKKIPEFEYDARGVLLSKYLEDEKVILLSNFQSKAYKRLVTAYLTSSYLLSETNLDFYIDYYSDELYDQEALEYAKDLLVPNSLLEKEIHNANGKIDFSKLNDKFNVPDFVLREKVKKFVK